MPVRSRQRERLLLPILVAAVAVGALLWWLRRESEDAARRVHFEDVALERLQALAQAEIAFHERTGRYGWLAELQAGGLTGGLEVVMEDGRPRVEAPRYRIDVLLPYGTTPGDYVRIAPRARGQDDPEMQRRHFAVVARPWSDALTGFRTLYLDETGHVFVSEGVSDIASRVTRPLPELHLSHGRSPDGLIPVEVAGLRFYRIDRLPPR